MSQKRLVEKLVREGVLKHEECIRAMEETDRRHYAGEGRGREVYEDRPLSIGHNATISAPHMHGYCLEAVREGAGAGAKVLDVGCGSGYLLACFARMVGPSGRVVGLEHVPHLAQTAARNVSADNPAWIPARSVIVLPLDAREGYPPEAPYDVIHVGAAVHPLPEAFVEQLKEGGLLVVPEGPPGGSQSLFLYRKLRDGSLDRSKLLGVRYVPLTSLDQQLRGDY